MFRTGFVLVALVLAAQNPADDTAFKKFADFAVGGVWAPNGANEAKEEGRWEWILDKKFARLTYKNKDQSFEEIHGIDPSSGKWTYFGFDKGGRSWKGSVTPQKGDQFLFESSGRGPKGATKQKYTTTLLPPNSAKLEDHELILDGQNQPLDRKTWTRKR